MFAKCKSLFHYYRKKKMKNAFYSTLKALFVLKIFKFLCPDFFGHVEKGLGQKLRLISKFNKLSSGKQIITIHTLPNISRKAKEIRQ